MFLYLDHDIISSIIFVKGIKISIFNPNRDVFKKSLKKIYIKKAFKRFNPIAPPSITIIENNITG